MKKIVAILVILSAFYGHAVFGEIVEVPGTNGNILQDTGTGLLWQMDGAAPADTWINALAYCNVLDIEGNDEWRLPSHNELQSIMDYSDDTPPLADDLFGFPAGDPAGGAHQFWTSTTANYDTLSAWAENFYTGYVFADTKTESHAIRCVSGSQLRTITTASVEHGSIAPSIDQTVTYGSSVSFTVTPDPYYHIDSVSGCTGGTFDSNTNIYTIDPVTENCEVTAVFAANPPGTIAVSANHGSVESTPAGIDCPGTCSHTFAEGQQVTLTATPDQGYKFTGWTGNDCSRFGTGNCVITIEAGESYDTSATFVEGSTSPWSIFLPAILNSCPNENNPNCPKQ